MSAADADVGRLVGTYTHLARPLLANQVTSMNRYERGRHVEEWKTAFGWLGKQFRHRFPGRVTVTVVSTYAARGFDTDAPTPAVKAALDGLVSVGVLVDDGPGFVQSVTYLAPVKTGADSLTLIVEEAE